MPSPAQLVDGPAHGADVPPAPRPAPVPLGLRDDARETVRAIGVVVLAYAVMTLGDVAAKWALVPAGIGAVMIGRGLAGSLTALAVTVAEGDVKQLVPVRRGMVALRSGLHAFVSLTWYLAWMVVSLADSYAVGFTAPLLMTLLAVPMLGERIRWRRALSTAVGFAGVLLMVRPGSALWRPEILILAPGIVAMAVSRIMARTLSTTETPACLTFWLMLGHVPAGLALLYWFPPPGPLAASTLLALTLLGVLNGIGHVLMARAYARAPVSALAPYEYTPLLWGGILGWLVFNELPGGGTLAGAAVVAAAGFYNLHRERVRRGAA